ncbi:hypothetical protein GCM10010302_39410 [Streptomyces polychromogenes]|uniref:Uncharacterized protein n=2 Tax=Streptomyces TaxID=1883 RepID=A0ABP3F2Z1_9ACTN
MLISWLLSGSTLTLDEQRVLYRRWSAGEGVLPHEALIGLAALLHAATPTEFRHLTLMDIATASRTIRFPGRSINLALDDATWRALEPASPIAAPCTPTTRTYLSPGLPESPSTQPAQPPSETLAPVGYLPRILRSTRLLTRTDELDIKQLIVALGMSYGGPTTDSVHVVWDAGVDARCGCPVQIPEFIRPLD